MGFKNLCRVCMKTRNLKSIFSSKKLIGGREASCVQMLTACAAITFNTEDNFPKHICMQCFKNLCVAYKFKIKCEKSYTYFLEFSIDVKDVKPEDIKEEKDSVLDGDLSAVENDSKFDDRAAAEVPAAILGEEACDDFKDEEKVMKVEIEDVDGYESFDSYDDVNLISLKNDGDEQTVPMGKVKKRVKKNKVNRGLGKQVGRTRLQCSICQKTFRDKWRLKAHEDSHLQIKRYFCSICKKFYRNEFDHKSMHRRGFKYKCEICNKCFNTKAKLSIHTETHSKDREKKFSCDVENCLKPYMTLSGLLRHKAVHTGQRNFVCHLCSKSFIDKYQLEVHIKMHTNDKAFVCRHCSKKFITSSARSAHEKWHTNTKNHHCEVCNKAFVSSSGLSRHHLVHTQELTLPCRFCDKKFARLDNRKRHETTMHGVSETTKNAFDT